MTIHKNYVEIIGNLGEDPSYKMSNNGQPRLTFDVCTSRAYKEGEEWKSKSTWLKCTAWGNLASTLNRMNFVKGERVQIEGELRNNNWVNTQNGEKHNDVYIQLSEMRKMAKPQHSSNGAQNAPQGNTQQQPATTQNNTQQGLDAANDDDLPF